MNIKKTNTGYENSFIFVACIHLKQISKHYSCTIRCNCISKIKVEYPGILSLSFVPYPIS